MDGKNNVSGTVLGSRDVVPRDNGTSRQPEKTSPGELQPYRMHSLRNNILATLDAVRISGTCSTKIAAKPLNRALHRYEKHDNRWGMTDWMGQVLIDVAVEEPRTRVVGELYCRCLRRCGLWDRRRLTDEFHALTALRTTQKACSCKCTGYCCRSRCQHIGSLLVVHPPAHPTPRNHQVW